MVSVDIMFHELINPYIIRKQKSVIVLWYENINYLYKIFKMFILFIIQACFPDFSKYARLKE